MTSYKLKKILFHLLRKSIKTAGRCSNVLNRRSILLFWNVWPQTNSHHYIYVGYLRPFNLTLSPFSFEIFSNKIKKKTNNTTRNPQTRLFYFYCFVWIGWASLNKIKNDLSSSVSCSNITWSSFQTTTITKLFVVLLKNDNYIFYCINST